MLTLKVLACLALSGLMLLPLIMHETLQPLATQTMHVPNVDGQAMWSRWPGSQ